MRKNLRCKTVFGCAEDHLQRVRTDFLHADQHQEILLLWPVRELGLSERLEAAAIGKTAESDLQGMRKSIHAQAVGCGLLLTVQALRIRQVSKLNTCLNRNEITE